MVEAPVYSIWFIVHNDVSLLSHFSTISWSMSWIN